MIDLRLERRLVDCQQLLKLWRMYHEYFALAVKGADITPEKEHKFLELKSNIAMLHDSLMESLTHDQAIGQNVLSIVSRSITLKHINRMSNAEIKKIEHEWHESYLLLNETVGVLEEKKQSLENISAFSYGIKNAGKKASYYGNRAVRSFYFKLLVIMIAIIFVIWGVPNFGIYDYTQLGTYDLTREPYFKLVNIYRNTIAKDYPFQDFERLDRKEKNRPPNFTDHNVGGYSLQQIVNQVYSNTGEIDIKDDLLACNTFRFESFVVDRRDFQLHMFLYNTSAKAREVKAKFDSWKRSLAPYQLTDKSGFAFMTSAFRKANLLVLIRTTRPVSEREDFMRMEFGIKE